MCATTTQPLAPVEPRASWLWGTLPAVTHPQPSVLAHQKHFSQIPGQHCYYYCSTRLHFVIFKNHCRALHFKNYLRHLVIIVRACIAQKTAFGVGFFLPSWYGSWGLNSAIRLAWQVLHLLSHLAKLLPPRPVLLRSWVPTPISSPLHSVVTLLPSALVRITSCPPLFIPFSVSFPCLSIYFPFSDRTKAAWERKLCLLS